MDRQTHRATTRGPSGPNKRDILKIVENTVPVNHDSYTVKIVALLIIMSLTLFNFELWSNLAGLQRSA